MNVEETKRILTVLRINYPSSFTKLSASDSEMLLKEWTVAFKDYPAKMVNEAIWKIINTEVREFAPNIAMIKKAIAEDSEKEAESGEDAWQSVRNCMKSFIWDRDHDRQLYESMLSDRTKSCISYDEVLNMAQCSASDNDQYKKPVFLKAFAQMRAQDITARIEASLKLKEIAHDAE